MFAVAHFLIKSAFRVDIYQKSNGAALFSLCVRSNPRSVTVKVYYFEGPSARCKSCLWTDINTSVQNLDSSLAAGAAERRRRRFRWKNRAVLYSSIVTGKKILTRGGTPSGDKRRRRLPAGFYCLAHHVRTCDRPIKKMELVNGDGDGRRLRCVCVRVCVMPPSSHP